MRVLYVKDAGSDAEQARRSLSGLAAGFNLEVVSSLDEALQRLAGASFDLVLSDLELSASTDSRLSQAPLLLLSGKDAPQALLHTLHDCRQFGLAERHARLLAASPALTYELRIDEHGRRVPVWVSENIEPMLGYTSQEVLRADWWWRNLHEDDQSRLARLQPTLEAQGELDVTYRFRHGAGHQIWVRDRQRLLHDEQGRPQTIVGTWNDVTDETVTAQMRALRAELRERIINRQALHRVLAHCARQIENTLSGLNVAVILDTPGGQGVQLIGGEALGEAYRAAVQCHAAELAAHLAGLDDSAQAAALRQALIKAGGMHSGRHLPMTGPNGQILGVLAVYPTPGVIRAPEKDEPRLAEFAQMAALAIERARALQFERQAFVALSSTRDGIVVTDLTPSIVSVNAAWSEMTGYSAEEALGRNPSLLKSGTHAAPYYETLWQTLKDKGYWQGEIWNRRKTGETYPQLLSISTVRDEEGNPTHYVGVMTDLSRLRHSEDEKERLTHYDPLTSLPNRLLVLSRLQHAIETAMPREAAIAVLSLDLDLFKHINESLGHSSGDQVLTRVAERLAKCLPRGATLARTGGDEFLVVIEQLEVPDDAARLARRLIDSLREAVVLEDGATVFTAASIGISLYPEDGQDAQTLVRHADMALHEAKALGRDQYCYYVQSLGDKVRQRLKLESHLRVALQQGELSLHYQPQVDIRSGRINGLEALMRWNSPVLGHVPPGEFIPVAEQSGLIFPMGRWALEEACRQNRAWQDEGLPALCVAVNVSVRQFHDPGLVPAVRRALEQSGLPPHCLEIELTESAFATDAESAVRTSHQLHELGVRLSLDDFGTGYSSLAYLSRFPFDKIKIDQSFVRDIASNPTNAAIANATIALADSLHMAVLAEGVETESQLGFLRQRGCMSMQGYLFSRPLPPAELAALLREARSLPAANGAEEAPRTLLLLDDEANILRALQRLLRQDGYRILATTRPTEAFDLLAQHRVQVIVSDQRMPEMSGTEFLSRVKELYPDTIRIVLSGYSEVETITDAVNRGAIYRFFTKPWDDLQLREELRAAFRTAEKMRHD